MNYSIYDLIFSLDLKIINLGIDARFIENPAFYSILANIRTIISDPSLVEFGKEQIVTTKDNTISFSYKGEKCSHTFFITCADKEFINIKKVSNEVIGYDQKSHKNISSTNIIEENINITTSNEIIIKKKELNFHEVGSKSHVALTSVRYSSDGIILENDKISYIGDVDSLESLFEKMTNIEDDYTYKRTLVREQFDTARLSMDARDRNFEFNGTIALNRDDLGAMHFNYNDEITEGEIIISPLSNNEIESIIEKQNPKLKDALRKLAAGRETYSYHSSLDPNFKRETSKSHVLK